MAVFNKNTIKMSNKFSGRFSVVETFAYHFPSLRIAGKLYTTEKLLVLVPGAISISLDSVKAAVRRSRQSSRTDTERTFIFRQHAHQRATGYQTRHSDYQIEIQRSMAKIKPDRVMDIRLNTGKMESNLCT